MTTGPTNPEAVQALLEQRARALAEPLPEVAAPRSIQILLQAGSGRVAVPGTKVREVLPPGGVMPLPRRDSALVGLRSTRHGPVAVADLAVLAGEAPLDPRTAVVVVLVGDDPIGLLAAAADVDESPPSDATTPSPGAPLPGAVRPDGVLVLDVDALLDDRRLRAPAPAGSPDPQGGPS